jgi:hypothetical protein
MIEAGRKYKRKTSRLTVRPAGTEKPKRTPKQIAADKSKAKRARKARKKQRRAS